MSTLKRITVILLLIALILPSAIIPSQAAYAASNDILREHMLRLLISIEHEKEFYGLKDVDLSNVTIGKRIPTYSVENQQLVDTNVQIYPILHEGKLVSMFFAITLPNGELYTQLGTELVKPLEPYTQNGGFAIVYDDLGVNVYNGYEIRQIAINPMVQRNTNTAVLETGGSQATSALQNTLNNVSISELEADFTLNIMESPLAYNSSRAVVSRSLNVPIIRQPSGTSICWAIAVTSILNYIYNYNLTYSTIVNQFNNGQDSALAISTVVINMNSYYNTNYVRSSNTTPSITTILNSLALEKPVYGSFRHSGNNYHAIVIRGANSSTRTFSVMNPTPNVNGYTAGTVSSSDVWTFYCPEGNATYTLSQHLRYDG